MSKSILVENCYECPYRKFNSVTGKGTCIKLKEIIYNPLEFLSQCPLQDTTELKYLVNDLTQLSKEIHLQEAIDISNKLYKALGGQENG